MAKNVFIRVTVSFRLASVDSINIRNLFHVKAGMFGIQLKLFVVIEVSRFVFNFCFSPCGTRSVNAARPFSLRKPDVGLHERDRNYLTEMDIFISW